MRTVVPKKMVVFSILIVHSFHISYGHPVWFVRITLITKIAIVVATCKWCIILPIDLSCKSLTVTTALTDIGYLDALVGEIILAISGCSEYP